MQHLTWLAISITLISPAFGQFAEYDRRDLQLALRSYLDPAYDTGVRARAADILDPLRRDAAPFPSVAIRSAQPNKLAEEAAQRSHDRWKKQLKEEREKKDKDKKAVTGSAGSKKLSEEAAQRSHDRWKKQLKEEREKKQKDKKAKEKKEKEKKERKEREKKEKDNEEDDGEEEWHGVWKKLQNDFDKSKRDAIAEAEADAYAYADPEAWAEADGDEDD